MTTASGGRKQQAEERRAQIVDAAVLVFAEKGFDGASMRDIAREVGVTEGLLYHYFESKEQLLHACWSERGWQAHMERILGRSDGVPLDRVLRELVRDFLQSMRDNSPMIRMCQAEMQRNGELAAHFVAKIEEGQCRLLEFLRGRQAAGEIRPDVDVRAAGGLLMGTAHAIFMLWGREDPEKWDPLVDLLVIDGTGIVLNGIAPRAGQPDAGNPNGKDGTPRVEP